MELLIFLAGAILTMREELRIHQNTDVSTNMWQYD